MADFTGLDTLEYSFADDDEGVHDYKTMPEQALWCAVINLAIVDAMGGSRTARDWLLCDREDFVQVCSLAGVSPFSVRTAARRMTSARP